jgi:hypothetical protein
MISHIRTNIFGYIIRTVHNGIAAGVITLDGLGGVGLARSNAGGAELGILDQFGQHALNVRVLIDIRRLGGIVAVNYRSPARPLARQGSRLPHPG